jgi:hypothetical protein
MGFGMMVPSGPELCGSHVFPAFQAGGHLVDMGPARREHLVARAYQGR